MIRVSIVEDDDKIREALIVLLEGSTGFRCISAYENAEQALLGIPAIQPDIVLMDINLPGMSGTECVRKLKAILPKQLIVMLTVYEESVNIFEALEAGASGYILKRTPPSELMDAIVDVYNGGSPMSSQIARKVVEYFHKKSKMNDALNSLTDRENEILANLAKGFRYKEIAEALFISEGTVHTHLRRIYEKLQVRSKTEAVLKYLQK